ncbi:MAG: kelch repeat-containing protein, partial [Bacteroidota bacterium]
MKTSNTTFCYPSKVIVFLLLSSSLCLNGQWAWMGGSQSTGNLGNYGTKGVPSINNMPRARYEAAQWTDKNGNFWLWGGQVISSPSSYLSDMWRYNPSTGEWTWMSGSSGANATAVFGTQGVPSVNNTPPASHCEATWVDTSGNFWLFGGDQYNDLWRYNPLTSEWTWMKGTQTGVSGNWGQKEVPATANIPPKTSEGCATWITLDNSLWFYGGSSWPNLWGTLWRYNVASNRWTWMSGSDMPNTPAVYGTKGVAHPFNTPGGRQTFASWKDNLERFWLYGGSIFDGSAGLNKNDLWMYDPESNMWTWMEGDTGTGYPGNFINKCEEGEIRGGNENKTGWVDRKGNLWTWGGG